MKKGKRVLAGEEGDTIVGAGVTGTLVFVRPDKG